MEIKLVLIKLLKYWLPPILWALIIFTFSNFPTVETTDFYLGDFLIKKSAHLIEYGILTILIYRGLIGSEIDNKKAIIYSIVIASLYGVTDEFHQSFIPGRGPSIRDVAIDTIGATIGVNLYEVKIWKRKS